LLSDVGVPSPAIRPPLAKPPARAGNALAIPPRPAASPPPENKPLARLESDPLNCPRPPSAPANPLCEPLKLRAGVRQLNRERLQAARAARAGEGDVEGFDWRSSWVRQCK
jgi:hypothetical protein